MKREDKPWYMVDEIAIGMQMNCHLFIVSNSSRANNGQAKQTNKKGNKT
jgi:hypothetical protein